MLWYWLLPSPRQCWLRFVVCVFGFSFCFHPANPGWGVVVCVLVYTLCLYPTIPGPGLRCACSGLGLGFRSPMLAGVFEGVCLWARSASPHPILAWVSVVRVGVRVWASPRQSWRGCQVCVWVRVLAAPRQSRLWCWGVLVYVRAVPAPRHPWLRCAVRLARSWLCLKRANPCCGLSCVCLGSGFALTPPFVAGVLRRVCPFVCSASKCNYKNSRSI